MNNLFSWENKDDNKGLSVYMPKTTIKALGPQGIGSMSFQAGTTVQPQQAEQGLMQPPPQTQQPSLGGVKKKDEKKTTEQMDYEANPPDFSSVPNYTGADPWDSEHYEGMFVSPDNPIWADIGSGLGELVNPVFDPSNYEGLLTGGLDASNPVFNPDAYEGTFINPDDPLGLAGSSDSGLLGTLSDAWQKISDYMPLIGLGKSVYDIVKSGEVTPASAMALGTSAVGAAGSLLGGVSMGPWGMLPAATLMAGQALANKPSREYFDPTYGMDLGDGKYLMMGGKVESDDDINYGNIGDTLYANTQGGGRNWDLIYDSNTNQFSRLDENALYDPMSRGSLNPEEYARQKYEEQQASIGAMDGFGGVDDVKTYDQILSEIKSSEIYKPDELEDLAGMGGNYNPPEWERAASPFDLYSAGLMSEDTIRQHALDAIENNQFTDLQYGMFKDAPAVVNFSKKYPMMLSSLQAAYQRMANQYGWGGTTNVKP